MIIECNRRCEKDYYIVGGNKSGLVEMIGKRYHCGGIYKRIDPDNANEWARSWDILFDDRDPNGLNQYAYNIIAD